jgi:hypothetical protein
MDHTPASVIVPAARTYRGGETMPERWTTWVPRAGDVLVCTPSKSGTTWTQTIIAMLLHGGPDLPDRVPVLSPWVDSTLGDADAVARALASQRGRRVVKTHTPADGFPVWDGVQVVAVYRHPLDVFFSYVKHMQNMTAPPPDHPMLQSASDALSRFVSAEVVDVDQYTDECLAGIAWHYRETVLSGRNLGTASFHYAEMVQNPTQTVRDVARAIGVVPSVSLVEQIVAATRIEAMRRKADRYAPEGGKGFFKNDAAFFASGAVGNWRDEIGAAGAARFAQRMAELIPDAVARSWLEHGGRPPGSTPAPSEHPAKIA